MKVVVVGGVAGGMSFAARARRLSEDAEIVVLEQDSSVSFGIVACRIIWVARSPNESRCC